MAQHSNLNKFPDLNAKILASLNDYNVNDPDAFNEAIMPKRPILPSSGDTHLIAASAPTK